MTPPALDWRSLAAKQRRMRDLLDRLAEVGPVDVGRLHDEPVTALAVDLHPRGGWRRTRCAGS